MRTDPGPVLGLLVAATGVLAGVGLEWTRPAPAEGLVPYLAAALALVALAGFALVRYERLDRRTGALLGGGGSLALVLAVGVALLAPAAALGEAPTIGLGPVVAGVAGGLGVGMGALTHNGTDWSGLLAQFRVAGVSLVLVATAFLAALVLASLLPTDGVGPMVQIALTPIVMALGLSLSAGLYLVASDRDRSFLDFRRPGVRELIYSGLGIVLIFGGYFAIAIGVQLLGLPATDNSIADVAKAGNPDVLLVLVPLSWLVIAPSEELLFRNVIQKSLYDVFSRRGAVVVASLLFAGAHMLAFASADPVATLVPLSIVFLLSLVIGGVYERTENLLVPIAIHGTYNAILFGLLYVALVYAPEGATAALLW